MIGLTLSTSAIFLVASAAAILQKGGYAQQLRQPNFTCDALNEFHDPVFGYRITLLLRCSRSENCENFTCDFFYKNLQNFVVRIEPCAGDDGMTPGVSVQVNIEFWNPVLDMVFLENSTVPLAGVDNITSLEVTLEHMDGGIIFGLRLLENGTRFPHTDLLYPRAIPIDSTQFTCPGVPRPNQQTTACAAMRAISEAVLFDPFGTCVLDERYCTSIRCTNYQTDISKATYSGAFQLSVFSILPCATPPALRVFIADTELQAQIDVTITNTTNNVLFLDQNLGSLNITMDVNSDMTLIGLKIIDGNTSNPRVYIPFTQIPIDTTLCSRSIPTSEPSNSPSEPSNSPSEPSYAPIYGIRLTGSRSTNMGRLEVVVNGRWGTICDQGTTSFFKSEADVACKQLGFGQAESYGNYASRVDSDANLDSSLSIVMRDVDCQNTAFATNLQSCNFQSDTTFCSHADDIGVTCSNCSLYLCADGECVNGAACDGTTECKDGSDENNIACAIVGGLSFVIKIVIGVGVTILVLIIAIPVGICICVCACSGACICCAKKRAERSRRHPDVLITSYAPAPQRLGPAPTFLKPHLFYKPHPLSFTS